MSQLSCYVMPYRLANSYQSFKESQCLHPLRELSSEGERITINWHSGNCQTIQRNIQEDLNVHQHTYKNFFLNDQSDALIIPILFCYKTLHVSGIFSTRHQEFFYCTFGTGKFHSGFWWPLPSRVRLELPDSILTLHEAYQCRMYSRKLLMMGREDARNT